MGRTSRFGKLPLLALGLLAVSVSAKADPRSELKELNSFLVDQVSSPTIEDNMSATRGLLAKRTSSFLPFKRGSTGTLQKFVALDTIKYLENKCDRESYSILLDICQANDFKGHMRPRHGTALSRIDSIILEYSTQHAEECKDIYPVVFEVKYKELDKIQLHRVETHANFVMHNFWPTFNGPYRNERDFRDGVLASIRFRPKYRFRHASCQALSFLANEAKDPEATSLENGILDERDGIWRVDKPKIATLAKTYLFGPCQDYVEELGPDIFEPFQFDLDVINGSRSYNLDSLKPGSQIYNFYSGLARYKFCKELLFERVLVERILVSCAQNKVNDAALMRRLALKRARSTS